MLCKKAIRKRKFNGSMPSNIQGKQWPLLVVLVCGSSYFFGAHAQALAQSKSADAPKVAMATPLLQPLNRTQFFVRPDAAEVLKWGVQGDVTTLACQVRDYHDKQVLVQTLKVEAGQVQLPLRLAQGFYEISFQPGGQRFGVVAQAPRQGAPDKFFALDAALSWLETRPEMRADLVALLKRSGIGLVRERLSWGAMNPQPNEWDFETPRQFDTLRQEYKRQNVELLELFHSAPPWAKIDASSPYPERLGATKTAWQTIGRHWQPLWNSFEVWNEPDIETGGELPADQYLPVVKTLNYGMRENKMPTLVGGGVFGYFNPSYIQNSVKNGLLDQVDFVSFHTYAKASALEQIITDYRRALTVNGQTVPLWITESGQPWRGGQDRPSTAEDATSAAEIAMKAAEARACGIARYFGFVYPFYVEGARNFGMMGQEVTPLRAMAGYVQAVAALSNTTYVGDLNLGNPLVQRARVFAQGDNAVIVLYAEKADASTTVAWTGAVASVQGADGRALKRLVSGAIPLSDGIAYVKTSLKALGNSLVHQTAAARLTAQAKSARAARPEASAVVLQPLLPATALPSKRGYKVADSALAAFPLRVRINNLSDTPRQVTLRCSVSGTTSLPERRVELAPQATQEVQWDVDLAVAFQASSVEAVQLEVVGQEPGGGALSPLALEMFSERDLKTYLSLYPASTKLDITDLTRWKPSITPVGQMKMSVSPEQTWQLNSSFKSGDRWVYPEYQLPKGTDLSGSAGLVVRARALAPATVRVMVKEPSGSTYFTPFSIVPPDGQWHALVLGWQDLAALPSAPPDANGQLDLNQITSFSLGMNSKSDENTLEVSDLYVARKPRQPVRQTVKKP